MANFKMELKISLCSNPAARSEAAFRWPKGAGRFMTGPINKLDRHRAAGRFVHTRMLDQIGYAFHSKVAHSAPVLATDWALVTNRSAKPANLKFEKKMS